MFEEQITAGIRFIDEDNDPSVWPYQIELDKLNMQSCTACIIGQLYGDFIEQFDDTDDPVQYDLGFAAPSLIGLDAKTFKAYAILTKEWKKKIRELRKERKVSRNSP